MHSRPTKKASTGNLAGKHPQLMVGAEGFEPPTLCSQSRSDDLLKAIEISGG
jgi:hypothetical protein